LQSPLSDYHNLTVYSLALAPDNFCLYDEFTNAGTTWTAQCLTT